MHRMLRIEWDAVAGVSAPAPAGSGTGPRPRTMASTTGTAETRQSSREPDSERPWGGSVGANDLLLGPGIGDQPGPDPRLDCWPWVRSLTHSPGAVIHEEKSCRGRVGSDARR